MAYAPDAEAFGIAAKVLGEDSTKWRDALRASARRAAPR